MKITIHMNEQTVEVLKRKYKGLLLPTARLGFATLLTSNLELEAAEYAAQERAYAERSAFKKGDMPYD